jgi:hypothetical protein
MQNKIIILTTKQNYQWTSMQEILPALEKTWQIISRNLNLKYEIIDVDTFAPHHYSKSFLEAKSIVVIAFNTKIASYIHFIRAIISCDARIFFHLHGLATIACWPLKRFGILPYLNSNDVFLGTCPGDKKCLDITFNKFKFILHVFPLDEISSPQNLEEKIPHKLVYIGRISRQKNLHTLISCYLEALKKDPNVPDLLIYGKEDHLGSPNLGLKCNDYLSELIEMTPKKYLNQKIFFKGFVNRHEIMLELGKNLTFISLSLHSDENFGMAALRSLSIGANVILSNWGGHKNYPIYFPHKTKLINLNLQNEKLEICLDEAIDSIIRINNINIDQETLNARFFSIDNVAHNISSEILKIDNESPIELKLLPLAEKVAKQQLEFEANGNLQQCFNNVSDQCYIKLTECYI